MCISCWGSRLIKKVNAAPRACENHVGHTLHPPSHSASKPVHSEVCGSAAQIMLIYHGAGPNTSHVLWAFLITWLLQPDMGESKRHSREQAVLQVNLWNARSWNPGDTSLTPTCASCGPFLHWIPQLTVANEGALGVLTFPEHADVGI